jgi:hypothetical protein
MTTDYAILFVVSESQCMVGMIKIKEKEVIEQHIFVPPT